MTVYSGTNICDNIFLGTTQFQKLYKDNIQIHQMPLETPNPVTLAYIDGYYGTEIKITWNSPPTPPIREYYLIKYNITDNSDYPTSWNSYIENEYDTSTFIPMFQTKILHFQIQACNSYICSSPHYFYYQM